MSRALGPDEELPPAFPEWLKRRVPILWAERKNGIYLAFRRRRLFSRAHVVRSRLTVAGICLSFLTLAVLFAFMPGGMVTPVVNALGIAFGTVVCFRWMTSGSRKSKGERVALPYYVGDVFASDGFSRQAAIDVWLCGYSVREVGEAILLEAYERHWRIVVASPFVLLAVTWPLAGATSEEELSFIGFVVFCTAGMLAWSVSNFMLSMMTAAFGTDVLRKRWSFANHAMPVDDNLAEARRMFSDATAPYVIAGTLFVPFLLVTCVASAAVAMVVDPLLAVGVLLVGASLYFDSIERQLGELATARWHRTIAVADYPFAAFMSGVVCEDPDAENWTYRVYGSGVYARLGILP